MKVVLRPATKHKFRFEYTPINYKAEMVLRANLVFNGIRFPVGDPGRDRVNWNAFRFGYE